MHEVERDMLLQSMGGGLSGFAVGPALRQLFKFGGPLHHLPIATCLAADANPGLGLFVCFLVLVC